MLTLTLKRTVFGNFDFCLLVLGTQYIESRKTAMPSGKDFNTLTFLDRSGKGYSSRQKFCFAKISQHLRQMEICNFAQKNNFLEKLNLTEILVKTIHCFQNLEPDHF